jgi:hypothetical protein
MKHLLRVLFVLALLCGGTSLAHADGIDYRLTVLDPTNFCGDSPTNSFCFFGTPGTPFNVGLSVAACEPFGLSSAPTTPPTPPTPFGCLVINNVTGATITSLNLTFDGPIEGQSASCDNAGQDGLASALLVTSCTTTPTQYILNFAGGTGVPNGSDLIVFEEGAAPSDFMGTATVNPTPEPDSLLLFSTGVMMAGLYMSRRLWTTARKSN